MSNFYVWENNDLLLTLYIIPNAKQDEVVGPYQHGFKIKIKAIPQDNKANLHIIKLLSQWFKVPKNHVTMIKGQQSRFKQFKIQSPRTIPEWIPQDESNLPRN